MILWIDDDRPSLTYYESEVNEAGFTTVMVSRVDEVKDVVKKFEGQWKLIILDVMMPTGEFLDFLKADAGYTSGVELARMIRTDDCFSSLRKVPMFFLTIYTGPEVVDYARENDITILRKDLATPADLVQRIVELARG